MTAFDSFPLGKPAFVTHILDRAAHLRSDDAKLLALEGHRDARAYVVYRDSLVVKPEAEARRALLRIDEALKFGANPGTIFLGLRDGAPVFGMGISAAAVESLLPHNDVAVTELRGMVMQGVVPTQELSAIAMAKSMVNWHQRHGYCANCGTRTAMKEGGWKRECPNCKVEHFPRTDPVVIMLVTSGDNCLLGRQKQFLPGMWSCLAGFVEAAETIEDAVLSVIADDRMHRARHIGRNCGRPLRTGGRPLVQPRRGGPDAQAGASRRHVCGASVCHRPSFTRALAAWRRNIGA
jgi:NAD+ diphosphatase